MNTRAKQSDIYHNWQMLSPDGILMARCGEKRANWYLSRGLAVQIESKIIQLKFKPAGNGNCGDLFMLEEKENICVVCGSNENLNRHHVVPYQYRRWMPVEQKGRSSHDVLPICLKHHDQYEVEAQKYSQELSMRYESPILLTQSDPEKLEFNKMRSLLKVVGDHRVPIERREQIRAITSQYFKTEITDEKASEMFTSLPTSNHVRIPDRTHGEAIISRVLKEGDLQDFIVGWRRHFIETMNPKFLSENWYTLYEKRT